MVIVISVTRNCSCAPGVAIMSLLLYYYERNNNNNQNLTKPH